MPIESSVGVRRVLCGYVPSLCSSNVLAASLENSLKVFSFLTSFWQDSSTPNSTQTTPSHAPTPTSSFPSARESSHPTPSSSTTSKAVANKKKKAADKEDDETDGKPAKRGKITYGRDWNGMLVLFYFCWDPWTSLQHVKEQVRWIAP